MIPIDSFHSIKVKASSKQVIVENPTDLPLIGRGYQGAVFLLPDARCVKIYAREREAEQERLSLQRSAGSPIVPAVYETGSNYMILEYFDGPCLFDHLRSLGRIPSSVTHEILYLFREIERLGFTKRDAPLRHVFVTNDQRLKLIDHVNSYVIKENRPKQLFQNLQDLGLLPRFLDKVKRLDPAQHRRWRKVLPDDFA